MFLHRWSFDARCYVFGKIIGQIIHGEVRPRTDRLWPNAKQDAASIAQFKITQYVPDVIGACISSEIGLFVKGQQFRW